MNVRSLNSTHCALRGPNDVINKRINTGDLVMKGTGGEKQNFDDGIKTDDLLNNQANV
jgi:hypothetical protein